MADCERGLGRPERAVALAQEPEAQTLSFDGRVELAIVLSGARLDLEQPEAAVAALATPEVRRATGELAARVAQARAVALEAAGRTQDAVAELAPFVGLEDEEEDEIVVFDLEEDAAADESDESEASNDATADGAPADGPDDEDEG